MLVTIIGTTCSGKSYYTNKLIEGFEYKRVKEFTTRPKRSGESDDAYYFITIEEMNKMIFDEKVYTYSTYVVANGETWCYGLLKGDIDTAKESSDLFILPTNIENMPKGKNVINCIAKPSDRVLVQRLAKRGDLAETSRRLIDDKDKLGKLELNNFIIVNENLGISELDRRIKNEI